MKKLYIFIIIGLIVLGCGFGFYFYKRNNSSTSKNSSLNDFPYNSTRVSTNDNSSNTENVNISSQNDVSQNETANNNSLDANNENPDNSFSNKEEKPAPVAEVEIASFTTKIYTKDSERQNNISITCSSLNDTTVENGKTFSFCNTVGKATTAKGYKKADVFKDGEKVEALGGGNCQVSSTLYNAVLKVSDLKVTERHEHSNNVPYVSKGKDAAVAYGSYDFKFVNNTGSKIKITSSCDKNYVYVKIFKLS